MIPAKIRRFLERHADTAVAGIRDRDLVPAGSRVSAWRVHPDGRTITVLIPHPLSERVISALEDNGRIAITVGEHQTHETYQLKGRYIARRAVDDDDLALLDQLRQRYLRSIRAELPPDVPEAAVLAIAVPTPVVAVDVDVEEVYLQTPGPGAGTRLYPHADLPGTDGQVGVR